MLAQTPEEIQLFKAAFLLGGLVCGAVGLGISYLFIKTLRVAISSRNWPMVEGKIVSSRVAVDDDGDYYPDISFSYNVSGVDYVSTAINPTELVGRSSIGLKAAESKIEEFPAGTPVKVYYKPTDPKKAVIEPGVTLGSFFFLVAAGLFLLGFLVFTPIGIFFNP